MSKFCTQCGSPVQPDHRFCVSCSAPVKRHETPVFEYPIPVVVQHRKVRKRDFLRVSVVMTIALLLIFLGVQNAVLGLVGDEAIASIQSHRQVSQRSDSGSSDPRRFEVLYAFHVGGEEYTGKTTQIFEYGISATRGIPIRYLSGRPQINAAAADAKMTGGLILVSAGVVIAVAGIQDANRLKRNKSR